MPAILRTLAIHPINLLTKFAEPGMSFSGYALSLLLYSYRDLHYSQQIAITLFVITSHELIYAISKKSYHLTLYAQVVFFVAF